jgi:predicted transcriptional regulator
MPRQKDRTSKSRRLFALRLDEDLVTGLRHIALDLRRPANQPHEEAIQDLLKKHREKRTGQR